MHVYEVRPRSDKRGVDLISDTLPFGGLWYAGPNAVANAIEYAKRSSRSHPVAIRVYDDAGNVIETHEQVCVSIFALTAVTSLGDAEQLCAIRKSPPADFYERADVQDCELMRGCPSGRAAIHRRDMRVIPLQVL